MYKNKTIGVVVPAYNEEKLISRVIETMPDFVDYIYVIDDCSRDKTAEKVQRLAEIEKYKNRLKLIQNLKNQGVGSSIVKGYLTAIKQNMDIVAVMAGDAQMDPDDLPVLLDAVIDGRADYAKGNRLVTGEAWRKIPHLRYLGNSFLSLLTKIASGYWHVADSQTGYTAVTREVLQGLPLEKLYKRYGYPNHLLVMLNICNCRVVDVPVSPIYNIGETSGIKLYSVIPRMLNLLLRLFIGRMVKKYIIRDFHPLVFFYVFAFLLLSTCLPLSVRLFWYFGITGEIMKVNLLALMFCGIMGFQSLFFAMWFDMEANKDLK
ncbi:MAG: glycosyltransferase family 2 protein [bacterium]